MSKSSRLEREILLLRQELAIMRSDRDELCRRHASHFEHCRGGESCKKSAKEFVKWDKSKAPNQDLYIAYLEEQIQRTRLKYKKQMTDVKSSASQLDAKLQSVRNEMNCITAKAQMVDRLQKSITALKAKVQRRDTIIARYNEQHAAFLGLINHLGQQSGQLLNIPSQVGALLSKSDSQEAGDCDGHRINSENESKPSLSFSCLGTALRNKLSRNKVEF